MLRGVLCLLVVYHISGAAVVLKRRRDPPLPLVQQEPSAPAQDSGSTYYQAGYQGYPAAPQPTPQQQQPNFLDGYREAQTTFTPQTFQGATTSQFSQPSSQTAGQGSLLSSQPGQGFSQPPQSSTSSFEQPQFRQGNTQQTTSSSFPQASSFPPQSGLSSAVNQPSKTGSTSQPIFTGQPSFPGQTSSNQPSFPGQTSSFQGQASTFPGQTSNFQGQTSNFQGQTSNFQGQTSSSQPSFPSQTSSNQPNFPGQTSNQASFPSQTSSQPSFPSQSSTSSRPTFPSQSSSQPVFPTQPSGSQSSQSSSGTSQPTFPSQPVFSGQPQSSFPSQTSGLPASSSFPATQPSFPAQSANTATQSSLPPQTASSPSSSNQPLPPPSNPSQPPTSPTPAPTFGLYVPPLPTDYDMRGCYTGTTWCGTSMSCVATPFYNTTCPGYREPTYKNNINLGCTADAQALWNRLNYTPGYPPQWPYLNSWSDGTMRNILLDFLTRVTDPSLDSYVAPQSRIATFDNDGTMWPEMPMLNQLAFLQWFVKRFPDPGQILQTQLAGYLDGTTRGDPMSAVLSGLNTDMYNDFIRLWVEETKHPTWARPYTELVFTPMIELINLMQAACFDVFVISGGENLFMRKLLPGLYGIDTPNLIGSFMDVKYEQSSTPGGGMEFKIYPRTPVVVDRATKPVAVQRNVGAIVPIFAAGNTDGDFEMLQYATTGSGPRMAILVKHDDGYREMNYELTLTRTMPAVPQRGWLFASMKRDFKEIFPRAPSNALVYLPRQRTPAPTPQPTPLPTPPKALIYLPRSSQPPLAPLTSSFSTSSSQPLAFTSATAQQSSAFSTSQPPAFTQPASQSPNASSTATTTAQPAVPSIAPPTAPSTIPPSASRTTPSTLPPSAPRSTPPSAPPSAPPTAPPSAPPTSAPAPTQAR